MSSAYQKHGIKLQKPNHYPNYLAKLKEDLSLIPEGHIKEIRAAVISPDLKCLVTSGEDTKVILWDYPSLKIDCVLKAHDHAVTSLAISQEKSYVASASSDFLIIIWDLEIKDLYTYFSTERTTINSLEFAADDQHLIAGCSDRTIKIWNIHTEQVISRIKAHTKPLKCIKLTKSLQIISCGDQEIHSWCLNSKSHSFTLKGHKNLVNSLSISPNDKYLSSSDTKGLIFIWNLNKSSHKFTISPSNGSANLASLTSQNFSADSSKLITANVCLAVRIFCAKTGKNLQNFAYHNDLICLVAFSQDSCQIVSVCADKRIRIFNNKATPDPDIKSQIAQTNEQHTDQVTTFVITSDKSKMITSGKGKEIRVWDLNSGLLVSTLYKHVSSVPFILISSDDQTLLSASQDQVLVLWDLKTFEPLNEFKSPNDIFLSACFFNQHSFVIAGGNDGIRVWDFSKRKQIGCLQTSKTRADSLALTSNGRFVVSGSGQNSSHKVSKDTGEKALAQFLFFVWDFKGFKEKLGLN